MNIKKRGKPLSEELHELCSRLVQPSDLEEKCGRIIDELKRVENLASFPEKNPNPSFELDRKGNVIYLNRAAVGVMEKYGIESNAFFPDFDKVVIDLDAGARKLYHDLTYEHEKWISGWWTAYSRMDRAVVDIAENLIRPIIEATVRVDGD